MEIAVFEVSEIFPVELVVGMVNVEVFAVAIEQPMFEFAFEKEIVLVPELGFARALVFFEIGFEFCF